MTAKTIFLVVFSIFLTKSSCLQLEPVQIVKILADTVNTLNRIYGQHINRPDFNQWFKTKAWKFPSHIDEEYDFIIVGSGSAGSVIANRLSEVPHWKILLLEAGRPETEVMQIPIAAPAFQNTEFDWGYLMEYQPNVATGLINQRMYWPRGKALGGTSTINYMIYTRGNPLDYERWAAQGNPGWSYKEVLPYFIKSERCRVRNADYNYHGTDGYQAVEDIYQSKILEAFIEGGVELGLPYQDYNSPEYPFVVDSIQATVLRGRRHSTARSFLWPVRNRPNLDIVISALVTKILINPETKEAYGVIYEKNGVKKAVRAKREVVLSAGTYHSPKLLMLSGIGPQKHLEELGIPLLQDLPVGQNLHDHICFPGMAFLLNQPVSLTSRNVLRAATTSSYIVNGTGRLTTLGGVEGIAYIKTEVSQIQENYPDIELLFVGASLASDYGLVTRVGMRFTDETFFGLFRPIYEQPTWTIFPMLLHPKSVGWMNLRSASPYDAPLFYGNYFTDPQNEDIRTLIAAIRVVQKISASEPMQRYGSTLNPLPTPGCQHYQFDSDPYWECSLRSIAVTLHHQVGTVKMGAENDPTAVVNNQLKVYGIGRLRVADCSIIPFALSAHTNAPAIMVGEKAADLIKADWGEI